MISGFEVGGIEFHFYGLLIGIAVVLAWSGAMTWAKRWKLSEADLGRFGVSLLVGGIIGARAYHVIDYWDYYRLNGSEILALWHGGLAIWGGIIGGVVGSLVVFYKHSKLWVQFLDAVAIMMPLSQALGRLGNFVNGELYGRATTLPWGIRVEGLSGSYHPLFAYEAGLNLLLYWMLSRLGKKKRVEGQMVGAYLIGYGVIRLVLEPLRIRSWSFQEGWAVASTFSVIAICVGIFLWFRVRIRKEIL